MSPCLYVGLENLTIGRNCGGSPGQWCTWASTLEGTQLGGREVPANAGDELVMHCMFSMDLVIF